MQPPAPEPEPGPESDPQQELRTDPEPEPESESEPKPEAPLLLLPEPTPEGQPAPQPTDEDAAPLGAARLRQRYLSVLSAALVGQEVSLTLHGQNEPVVVKLEGVCAQDGDLLVANLPTGLGVVPHARLRAVDVVLIEGAV